MTTLLKNKCLDGDKRVNNTSYSTRGEESILDSRKSKNSSFYYSILCRRHFNMPSSSEGKKNNLLGSGNIKRQFSNYVISPLVPERGRGTNSPSDLPYASASDKIKLPNLKESDYSTTSVSGALSTPFNKELNQVDFFKENVNSPRNKEIVTGGGVQDQKLSISNYTRRIKGSKIDKYKKEKSFMEKRIYKGLSPKSDVKIKNRVLPSISPPSKVSQLPYANFDSPAQILPWRPSHAITELTTVNKGGFFPYRKSFICYWLIPFVGFVASATLSLGKQPTKDYPFYIKDNFQKGAEPGAHPRPLTLGMHNSSHKGDTNDFVSNYVSKKSRRNFVLANLASLGAPPFGGVGSGVESELAYANSERVIGVRQLRDLRSGSGPTEISSRLFLQNEVSDKKLNPLKNLYETTVTNKIRSRISSQSLNTGDSLGAPVPTSRASNEKTFLDNNLDVIIENESNKHKNIGSKTDLRLTSNSLKYCMLYLDCLENEFNFLGKGDVNQVNALSSLQKPNNLQKELNAGLQTDSLSNTRLTYSILKKDINRGIAFYPTSFFNRVLLLKQSLDNFITEPLKINFNVLARPYIWAPLHNNNIYSTNKLAYDDRQGPSIWVPQTFEENVSVLASKTPNRATVQEISPQELTEGSLISGEKRKSIFAKKVSNKISDIVHEKMFFPKYSPFIFSAETPYIWEGGDRLKNGINDLGLPHSTSTSTSTTKRKQKNPVTSFLRASTLLDKYMVYKPILQDLQTSNLLSIYSTEENKKNDLNLNIKPHLIDKLFSYFAKESIYVPAPKLTNLTTDTAHLFLQSLKENQKDNFSPKKTTIIFHKLGVLNPPPHIYARGAGTKKTKQQLAVASKINPKMYNKVSKDNLYRVVLSTLKGRLNKSNTLLESYISFNKSVSHKPFLDKQSHYYSGNSSKSINNQLDVPRMSELCTIKFKHPILMSNKASYPLLFSRQKTLSFLEENSIEFSLGPLAERRSRNWRTPITRSELAYANSDSTSEPTPPKGGATSEARFARTRKLEYFPPEGGKNSTFGGLKTLPYLTTFGKEADVRNSSQHNTPHKSQLEHVKNNFPYMFQNVSPIFKQKQSTLSPKMASSPAINLPDNMQNKYFQLKTFFNKYTHYALKDFLILNKISTYIQPIKQDYSIQTTDSALKTDIFSPYVDNSSNNPSQFFLLLDEKKGTGTSVLDAQNSTTLKPSTTSKKENKQSPFFSKIARTPTKKLPGEMILAKSSYVLDNEIKQKLVLPPPINKGGTVSPGELRAPLDSECAQHLTNRDSLVSSLYQPNENFLLAQESPYKKRKIRQNDKTAKLLRAYFSIKKSSTNEQVAFKGGSFDGTRKNKVYSSTKKHQNFGTYEDSLGPPKRLASKNLPTSSNRLKQKIRFHLTYNSYFQHQPFTKQKEYRIKIFNDAGGFVPPEGGTNPTNKRSPTGSALYPLKRKKGLNFLSSQQRLQKRNNVYEKQVSKKILYNFLRENSNIFNIEDIENIRLSAFGPEFSMSPRLLINNRLFMSRNRLTQIPMLKPITRADLSGRPILQMNNEDPITSNRGVISHIYGVNTQGHHTKLFTNEEVIRKRKTIQKKRRITKLKKETRRRKKRMRFYPRPIWLRYRFYSQFAKNRRHNKSYKGISLCFNKKRPLAGLSSPPYLWGGGAHLEHLHSNLLARPYKMGIWAPKSLSYKEMFSKVGSRYANRYPQKSSLFAPKNLLSMRSDGRFPYTTGQSSINISSSIMGEFKTAFWKSYWLRSNLKPYFKKIKTSLKDIKETPCYSTNINSSSITPSSKRGKAIKTQISQIYSHFFINVRDFIISFLGINNNFTSIREGYSDASQTSSHWPVSVQTLSKKDVESYYKTANYLAEYNQISAQRIQQFVGQIRENLTLNGHVKVRPSRIAMNFGQKGALTGKKKNINIIKRPTLRYNAMSRLRLYWAFSKGTTHLAGLPSSLLPGAETINGNNYNKRKQIWTTEKFRQQIKENKTKKLWKNIKTKFKFFVNETPYFSLESNVPLWKNLILKSVKKTRIQEEKLQNLAFLNRRAEKSLTPLRVPVHNDKETLKRLIKNKSELVPGLVPYSGGPGNRVQGSLAPISVRQFNMRENRLKNSFKRTAQVQPFISGKTQYWWTYGNNTSLNGVSSFKATPTRTRIEQENIFNSQMKKGWTSSSLKSTPSTIGREWQLSALHINTILFHFCSLITLLSISQIRGLLKFTFIGVNKVFTLLERLIPSFLYNIPLTSADHQNVQSPAANSTFGYNPKKDFHQMDLHQMDLDLQTKTSLNVPFSSTKKTGVSPLLNKNVLSPAAKGEKNSRRNFVLAPPLGGEGSLPLWGESELAYANSERVIGVRQLRDLRSHIYGSGPTEISSRLFDFEKRNDSFYYAFYTNNNVLPSVSPIGAARLNIVTPTKVLKESVQSSEGLSDPQTEESTAIHLYIKPTITDFFFNKEKPGIAAYPKLKAQALSFLFPFLSITGVYSLFYYLVKKPIYMFSKRPSLDPRAHVRSPAGAASSLINEKNTSPAGGEGDKRKKGGLAPVAPDERNQGIRIVTQKVGKKFMRNFFPSFSPKQSFGQKVEFLPPSGAKYSSFLEENSIEFSSRKEGELNFTTSPLTKSLLPTAIKDRSILNSLLFIQFALSNGKQFSKNVSSLLGQRSQLEAAFRSIYTFFEKPGVLIVDWIAYLFLVEWASDITTTLPENVDTQIAGSSFNKLTRFIYNIYPFLPIYWTQAVMNQAYLKGVMNYDLTSEVLTPGLTAPFGKTTVLSLASTFLKRRIYHLYEILLLQFYQPDTDLLVRQKKGIVFWDIWGDFLTQTAEDSNINISELTSLKEEQIKLLENAALTGFDIQNDLPMAGTKSQNKPPSAFKDPPAGPLIYMGAGKNESSPGNKVNGKDYKVQKSPVGNQGKAHNSGRRPGGITSPGALRTTRQKLYSKVSSITPLKYLLTKNLAATNSPRISIGTTGGVAPSPRMEGRANNKKAWTAQGAHSTSIMTSFKPTTSSLGPPPVGGRAPSIPFLGVPMQNRAQNSGSSLYQWGSQQFLSYAIKSKDTELFIDLHPPRALSSVLKNKHSSQQLRAISPMGSLVCQIFAGILYKQISKNILIVGNTNQKKKNNQGTNPDRASQGSSALNDAGASIEKTLLVQAIAGETELKIITDNAYRYALVYRGVAVGIKLLRDVFDSLSLQTPCFFLIEDIHAIGERRPFLISDDTPEGGQNTEIHEKNQVLYQLSKHVISHYKKPYKGDFSLSIPTNHFCFDFFKGRNQKNLQMGKASMGRQNTVSPKILHNQTPDGVQEKQNPRFLPSRLLRPSTELLSPPATSPFSVLTLKEDKKLKTHKKVSDLPWTGRIMSTTQGESASSQDSAKTGPAYSIRAKVALLADIAISSLSVQLDMITDLLVIIDSVKGNRGFVVFATTHIPFVLDPALRRPGRLDETISFGFSSKSHPWEVSQFGILNVPRSTYSVGSSAAPIYGPTMLSSMFASNVYTSLARRGGASLDFSLTSTGIDTNIVLGRLCKKAIQSYPFSNSFSNSYLKRTSSLFHFFNQNLFKKNSIKGKNPPFIGALRTKDNVALIQPGTPSFNYPNTTQILSQVATKASAYFNASMQCSDVAQNTNRKSGLDPFSKPDRASQISASVAQSMRKDERHLDLYMNNALTQLPDLSLESTLSNSSHLSMYASPHFFKKNISVLISGKIGEFLLFSNTSQLETMANSSNSSDLRKSPYSSSNIVGKGNLVRGLYGSSMAPYLKGRAETRRTSLMPVITESISSLVLSFIQKRFLYKRNLMLPTLFNLTNYSSLMEPSSPPISSLLLPAKRYENLKRSLSYYQNNDQNLGSGIMEKINIHQQQRLVKRLYNIPVKESFQSEIIENRLSSFSNASLMIGSMSPSRLQKTSSSNWFVRNRIFTRHSHYLTNQWWTGQLPEHNAETTFLSDIDWRYTFVEREARDILLDFPDADQHYNPRNRRWVGNTQSTFGTIGMSSLTFSSEFASRKQGTDGKAAALTEGSSSANTSSLNNSFIEENSIEFSSRKLEYFAPEGGKNSTFCHLASEPMRVKGNSHIYGFANKTSTENTFYSDIYSHFIYDSFIKAFNIYEQNREVFDYYAFHICKQGLHCHLHEFERLKLIQRFLQD